MIKFQRSILETERLFLKPYDIKLYNDVYHLIQKNKLRLVYSFPLLLRATETEIATKDYVQQKIFDWNNNKAYGLSLIHISEPTRPY